MVLKMILHYIGCSKIPPHTHNGKILVVSSSRHVLTLCWRYFWLVWKEKNVRLFIELCLSFTFHPENNINLVKIQMLGHVEYFIFHWIVSVHIWYYFREQSDKEVISLLHLQLLSNGRLLKKKIQHSRNV